MDHEHDTLVSCINEFSSYLTLSPWITIWMKFCPRNNLSTSEIDESFVFCSIWTKCDCSFCCWHFLTRKLQAPTTRLAAPLHQNKASCQKNIHNHILFICYTTHLIHQFLKCSSCSLDKTSSKLLFTVIMCGKMKIRWYNYSSHALCIKC